MLKFIPSSAQCSNKSLLNYKQKCNDTHCSVSMAVFLIYVDVIISHCVIFFEALSGQKMIKIQSKLSISRNLKG